jgi:hypothetical protein
VANEHAQSLKKLDVQTLGEMLGGLSTDLGHLNYDRYADFPGAPEPQMLKRAVLTFDVTRLGGNCNCSQLVTGFQGPAFVALDANSLNHECPLSLSF